MIDTSKYDEHQSEVFDDIMDSLTPSQRNRVLGINVKAANAVRTGDYTYVDSITEQVKVPRKKMTFGRLLFVPVVVVTSITGFVCMLLAIALMMTVIGIPIGLPMFMGSSAMMCAPWQKLLYGKTGNLTYSRTVS